MNILITGSSGYIGSNVVSNTFNKHNLTCIDINKPQIVQNTKFINFDITSNDWSGLDSVEIDVVIHLSQSPFYREFPDKSDKIINVNINGTLNLLEWCRKKNIKRFIFASTGNVYKSQDKFLSETDICEPIDFYGTSKYCGELICMKYSTYFEIIVLRIFGVYGPNQKNMMIQRLIETIKNKNIIKLAKGKGLLINPIYISDVVEIFERLISVSISDKYAVFNVSGQENLSYALMAEIISKQLNMTLRIENNQNEPVYLTGSNNKITKLVNFKPQINFIEGVKNILN